MKKIMVESLLLKRYNSKPLPIATLIGLTVQESLQNCILTQIFELTELFLCCIL